MTALIQLKVRKSWHLSLTSGKNWEDRSFYHWIMAKKGEKMIQGFWYFAEEKAKFRGIFRGKFAEKSADFAGFSRGKEVEIRKKIGRFRGRKVKIRRKIGRFHGKFRGKLRQETISKKQPISLFFFWLISLKSINFALIWPTLVNVFFNRDIYLLF